MITEEGLAHDESFMNRRRRVEPTQTEIDFNAACFRFSASLMALKVALQASNATPGEVFLVQEERTPPSVTDLQARWAAASIVMNEAVNGLVKDGTALVAAVKALAAE